MFNQLKKLIKDTTQVNGNYVGKDVRNMLAFSAGLLLCFVSAIKSAHVHNELALQAGGVLLAYSLGGTAFKSYYQYKNNAVAADADSCDNTSTGVDDADDVKPTPKADI